MNKNLLRQRLSVMLVALTACISMQSQTFTHYSEWMAYSRRNMVYTKTTPPYSTSDTGVDWWRYDDGLMYESILDTYEHYKTQGGKNSSDLLSGVERYLNMCITGTAASPLIANFTGKSGEGELDDMRPGRLVYKYCYTYDHSENAKIDIYKAACAQVINASAFSDSKRVGNSNGANPTYPWQHKANYANQVWLDGIFMGIPFWTLAGPNIGTTHHSNWTATDFFDDAYNQMIITDEKTYDSSTNLWKHAWDYTMTKTWADCSAKLLSSKFEHTSDETAISSTPTGRSCHTWGRALGWYAMAILETMDNITAVDDNYSHLGDLRTLFKKVMDAIISYRDETTGVWYCVMDVDDTKSPYNSITVTQHNYPEATCSSMFAYCLLRGVAKGYLDSSYLNIAKDVYKKVVDNFITTSGDNINLNSCMQVGGLDDSGRDGSFAYYMSEPVIQDDSKGVGPFIWASLEAEKIGYNIATNDFDNNTLTYFGWSKMSDDISDISNFTTPTFTATTAATTLSNNSEIDFTSSNTSVATVGTDGTVTLTGTAGTAIITAALKSGSSYSWGNNSPTYTVTVTAPDNTAPTLSSTTPAGNATDIATSGTVVLTFDEAVTVANASGITISPSTGVTWGTATVDVSDNKKVNITYSGLSNSTQYTVTIANNAITDASGNAYTGSNFSFTTATAATTTLTAESDKTWDFTSSTQFTQAASADYKFETYTVSDNIGIGSNTVLKTETTGSSGKPQRLMLSGNNTSNSSGVSSTQESVHFKVAAHSKITVNAVGGANRNIKIDSGTFGTGTNLLSSTITSSSRTDFTAYYNGDSETDIYIYESTGNGNITLYSITVEPTYALTKGTETNGTFTLSPSDRAAAGETITVTTTPASGYEVSAVTTTPSTTVTTVTADSKYTFTMPTQATTVNVTFTTAAAPELSISTQPTGASYTQNATATALTVSATGGTSPYTYQWYSNSSNSTTGATAISNATSASYTPSTATVGTIYYYCIVTDAASATVTSNIVAVTVSAASSSTSYTLVSDPTGTPALTSDFLIGSLTLNQNTAATIDDIAFKKAIKFGSSLSSISGKNVGDNNICYDVKTSSTKFTIYVSGGTGTLYFSKIAEGENSTTAESKTISTNPQKLEFTLSSTTNTRVGFSSSNTSMYIYQIVAEETGTAHKQAGEAGYVLNLNKGRYSGNKTSSNSGKTGKIDNIEIVSYNSYTHTNTTTLELSKNTADTYVKFTTGTSPSKLKVTFSAGTLIANTSASTTGGTALTSNTAQALSANTTYYIINTNTGNRALITNIAFEAATEAKVATPTITPADGTVFEGTTQSVSISCDTSGASIYYTDDGTEPTTSSTAYSSAFTIYGTKTIKAIAVKSGMTNSDVATATITNTCLNEYNATDGTLILKEAATEYTPVAATGVDVTLVRTLQANKWNALCLPFDVTPAMFSNATNGAETQIETLQQVKNNTFIFAAVNEVAAGTPFIAKPVANIANPVFEDVQIKAVSAGTVTKDEYSFKGNYTKVTLDPTIHLFISMSQQKLVSPTGSNILQGLRGYFIVPEGSDAKAGLDFDGEVIVTDIDQLNAEHLPFVIDDNTPIYNLSGQRVSKSYKGIVIIKGKKIVR